MTRLCFFVVLRDFEIDYAEKIFSPLIRECESVCRIHCQIKFFIQTDDSSKLKISTSFEAACVSVIFIDYCSLSRARNIALETSSHDCNYFMFLDCNSFVSSDSFLEIEERVLAGFKIMAGVARFQGLHFRAADENFEGDVGSLTRYRLLRSPYVWSYVFKADCVDGIFFDENIGIGSNGIVQCGEDIIFLADTLRILGLAAFEFNNKIVVDKPMRPEGLVKQKLYSFGQGAIWRRLLGSYRNVFGLPVLLLHIFLFFGNGFRHFIVGGSDGKKVFVGRVKGFMYRC